MPKNSKAFDTVLSKGFFTFLYTSVSAAECYFEYISFRHYVYFLKPMAIILLMLHFISTLGRIESRFKNLILGALMFSLLGDVALMLVDFVKDLFLLGIAFFLIAHLFFIGAFAHNIRSSPSKASFFSLFTTFSLSVIPAGMIYKALYDYFKDSTGDLFVPVFVYFGVITLMGIVASFRHSHTTGYSYWFILLGALIFACSDLTIGLSKFKGYSDDWMGIVTMATYFLAQYMIVEGSLHHIFKIEGPKEDKKAKDVKETTRKESKKAR
mmetsp:Transcript_21422/g.24890  ORF Transcript_21422/g.24890 Transcript_21422/m.24890 type:complete len:268 (+) Transcript_21422:51-854(+)